MARLLNNLSGFLVFGVFIALFIGLLILLAKVMFYGIIIGAMLFAFFWVKKKILGESQVSRDFREQFQNQFNQNARRYYTKYRYTSYTKKNSNGHSQESQTSTRQGRIIDIDPED